MCPAFVWLETGTRARPADDAGGPLVAFQRDLSVEDHLIVKNTIYDCKSPWTLLEQGNVPECRIADALQLLSGLSPGQLVLVLPLSASTHNNKPQERWWYSLHHILQCTKFQVSSRCDQP